MSSRFRNISLAFLLLGLAQGLYAPASGAAEAETFYLRPNGDFSKINQWTVIGAENAWEALNDDLDESQAANKEDYITSGPIEGASTKVSLTTRRLEGAVVLDASAWFFTPNKNSVVAQVMSGTTPLTEPQTFADVGWHSIPVDFDGSQLQLNRASVKFDVGPMSGRRKVYAAFLKLTLGPPGPSVYWGAWMDGDVYGGTGDAPWSSFTWNEFEAHAGKAASIVHFGQPAPWIQGFSAPPLNSSNARGAIPLIDMDGDGAPLASISAGAFDADLVDWARAARAYGRPFFLRWAWEMNGKWFQWGAEAAADPQSYVAAWRHFHDIAEAQGATNVTWVWCPNTIFPGSTPLSSLYPGDDYVDWTCLDGYNFGSSNWVGFHELVAPTYNALLSLAPTKPIMIGETASAEAGGSKAAWIADALEAQIPVNFPRIKAVTWFNWNILEQDQRREWPIESSSASNEAFAKAIASPYYAANTFGALPPLTPIQPLP